MTGIKTTFGALVKHNGLMLAQPTGKALTIFDLRHQLYRSQKQIGVFKKEKLLASLALEDLDDYMLQEGNYYDFGECSSLKEFCERLIPVGRLVGAVKEILFYATRKGSKVILMVGKGEDGFSSVLARCCKYQGVYLSNVELENRAGDNGVDSSSQFYRMVGRSLQNMDYQSVRLFSDNKDNLKAFLNLRSRFDELLFEGYWVGASGFPRVMM